MADLLHDFGGDLLLTADGDLSTVQGQDEVRQALCHRLLTSAGSYVWHTDYGAGLRQVIGSCVNGQQIAAIIRAQLSKDSNIAAVPPPSITINRLSDGYVVATVEYTDVATGGRQRDQITME